MEEVFDDVIHKFWKSDRVRELSQVAKEASFRFKSRVHFSEQPSILRGFHLFRGSKSRRLIGLMSKEEKDYALKTRIYDYIYYGNAGKKKTTVFEIQQSAIDLPSFSIQPKGAISKVKGLFMAEETLFPVPEFNAQYRISCTHPASILETLNESFLELLATKKGMRVEGNGSYLLFYTKNKRTPTHKIIAEYNFVLHLWDQLLYGESEEKGEFV